MTKLIGIIGAMEEELRLLQEEMDVESVETIYGYTFYKGTLHQQAIVLVKSGIGKVNASICTTLLVQCYNVSVIINTGTAGAIDSTLSIGDVIIGYTLTHHDVDVTAFNYVKGQMAGMPEMYYPDVQLMRLAQQVCRAMEIEPILGQIVSGDQFVHTEEGKEQIRQDFPQARACEMESAAIAQAAYVLGVPCVIIRAISDGANDEAAMSFDEFVVFAGRQSAQLVSKFVHEIGVSYDS